MNTQKIKQLLMEAHERTGLHVSFQISTIHSNCMQVFIPAPVGQFYTISSINDLKAALDSIPTKGSNIQELINKRDALQRQIDAAGGEDIICN